MQNINYVVNIYGLMLFITSEDDIKQKEYIWLKSIEIFITNIVFTICKNINEK